MSSSDCTLPTHIVHALYYSSPSAKYLLCTIYPIVVASELAGFTIILQGIKETESCDLCAASTPFGLVMFGSVVISTPSYCVTNFPEIA